MKASLIKKVWRNSKKALCTLGCILLPAIASAAPKGAYEAQVAADVGFHLFSPQDLATNQYFFQFDEKWVFSNEWLLTAGAREIVDTAFYINRARYSDEARKEDTFEFTARDLYIQYQKNGLLVRVGNQQVVWGEAFGFYYADIVNPKDLRELGIGDLEIQRYQIPMVNAKYMTGKSSLQLIYIPQPFFNRVPTPGTDFGFPFNHYAPFLPGYNFEVHDVRSPPFSFSNSEFGLRATTLISPVDLSLFFFYYLDRNPNYVASLSPTDPLTIELDPTHHRLKTLGTTATADLAPFVLRVEALYNLDRYFDAIQGTQYVSQASDEIVSVVGLDFPEFDEWKPGIQVSEDILTHPVSGAINPNYSYLASLRIEGPGFKNHKLGVIFSYVPNDGSNLTQAEYVIPLSGQTTLKLGADILAGNGNGEFGLYHEASRFYVSLRGFFGN